MEGLLQGPAICGWRSSNVRTSLAGVVLAAMRTRYDVRKGCGSFTRG